MSTKRVNPILYIVKQLWYFKSFTLQSFLLMALMAIVNLPLPLMNKVIIDIGIPSKDSYNVILIGLLAFFVRGMASVFQVLQNFVIRQVMAGIADRLRMKMVHSLLNTHYTRYVSGEVGSFVGRLSSDVNKLELMIFDTFRFVLRPISMIVVMVYIMSLINIPATILILLIAPAGVFFSRTLSENLKALEKEVLKKREKLQKSVSEVLDNIRVIRCFNKGSLYKRKITSTIRGYTDTSVEHASRKFLMQNIIEFLGMIPWLLLVVIGTMMINGNFTIFGSDRLSVGDFMAFITFEQLLRTPLAQLSLFILRIKSEMVGPQRVQEVIDLDSEYKNGSDLNDVKGEIEFDNIVFSYPSGAKVLNGLCETVEPGERVAVVGGSGAGKTTVISLLLGFYKVTEGTIKIDGISIDDLNMKSLRRNIGVVFQDNAMFDATIRYNITLGSTDADENEIWDALETADAASFVRGLPNGLDTVVGVKGLKLSGGQRQRLAIARVILKNPSIILMDEATSSLDSVSEYQIKRAMDRMLQGRTSITIAHRLSTIVEADRIFYLEKGRVIESGKHSDLLIKKGKYHELFKLQTDGLLKG